MIFKNLFFLIDDICKGTGEKRENIKKCCNWMLVYPPAKKKETVDGKLLNIVDEMEDDILKSLLEYGEDELCLDFMGYYKVFLDQDLLLYSL